MTTARAVLHVNGKWLAHGLTGTERYADRVVHELLRADEVDLLVHVPRDATVPWWLGSRGVVLRHRRRGLVFEQLVLPWATRREMLLNLAGPAPLLKRSQLVLMHDAAPMRWPDSFSRRFRAWYALLYFWLSRISQVLVTVSEFSASELSTVLGLPQSRFRVAPCGSDHATMTESQQPALPPSFDSAAPFLLCVGTLARHKNLVASTRTLTSAGWQVVVVGAGGPGRVFAPGEAALPDAVIGLGRVSEEELAWCYDHALALVFPSRYEGFGLPVVEAQARGCPVIASDAASLPEVTNGSALLFDPDDTQQLVAHVELLARDPRRREALVAAGRANAGRYRWPDTAAALQAAALSGRVTRAPQVPEMTDSAIRS